MLLGCKITVREARSPWLGQSNALSLRERSGLDIYDVAINLLQRRLQLDANRPTILTCDLRLIRGQPARQPSQFAGQIQQPGDALQRPAPFLIRFPSRNCSPRQLDGL